MSEPRVFTVIIREDELAVLLLPEAGGWTLPCFNDDRPPGLRSLVREQLGLDAILLGSIAVRLDDEREPVERLVAMEARATRAGNAGGRWLPIVELQALPFASPEHAQIVRDWLTDVVDGNQPDQRAPWARPGWWARTATLLQSQLEAHGFKRIGDFEQLRVTPTSSVLRLPATPEDLYWKATTAVLGHEPVFTAALSRLWPASLPRVVAYDAQQHWMLMADAGRSLRDYLRKERDIALWEQVLREYAELQAASVPHLEQFRAMGCPDRRLAELPALYRRLGADPLTTLPGRPGGMSEAELRRLDAFAPEVEALCESLARFHIPETLHHDDFHTGNIHLRDGRAVFVDWAESCLAHPFYSLVIALRDARYVLGCRDAELRRLQDAYLQAWTAFDSLDRIQEAWPIARRLGKLVRAATWSAITRTYEPAVRVEYEDAAAYWLRMFVEDAD